MNFQQFLEVFVGFSMQKILLIGLAFGGFYYYSFFNDGSGLSSQILDLKNRVQLEEEKVKDTRKTLEEKDRMEAEVNKLIQEYKNISGRLPTTLSGIDVVKLIDSIAKEARVSIKRQAAMSSVQKEVHEEVPVKLELKGTFSQISQFIYLINNHERITRVRNIKIYSASDLKLEKGKVILNFEGEVVGYRFVGEKKK